MKQSWLTMGMPAAMVIEDTTADQTAFQKIQDYFQSVDDKYSSYKPTSEVSRINAGLPKSKWSREMKTVMELCEETKTRTNGYFDPFHKGIFDPSGLVKGWAIQNATSILSRLGYQNFYVDIGGDVQAAGHNAEGQPWSVGIRNPFKPSEIVKVMRATNRGIATSGTYIRGQHIYSPVGDTAMKSVASLTVIGPSIYDADRFATAAFAMGRPGIRFIESLDGFEAYMITADRQATLTSGLGQYVETA